MNFEHPLFLWAIPLVICALVLRRKKRFRKLPLFSSLTLCSQRSQGRLFFMAPEKALVCAILFSIIALANPLGKVEVQTFKEIGYLFSFAFDISGSMTSMGSSGTTSLFEAKKAARTFIEQNKKNAFAVLPFSATARFDLGIPFTTDRLLVSDTIKSMSASGATAVGNGILGATWHILSDVYTLQGKERSLPSNDALLAAFIGDESQKASVTVMRELIFSNIGKTKGAFIIAITDANSNAGVNVLDAIEFAGILGIPVYLIGVNANLPPETPIELKRFGGGYFPVDSPDEIQGMYNEINKVKPTIFQKSLSIERKSLRWEFIFVAMLLIGLAFIVRMLYIVIE